MAIEKPEVNGIAHALPPPDVVRRALRKHGDREEHHRDREKKQLRLHGCYSLVSKKIVIRRWLRSSPGGGRPHADDGIMPTYKTQSRKIISAQENQCSSATAPATYIIVKQNEDIGLQQRDENVESHE